MANVKLTLPRIICEPPLSFCCTAAFFAANRSVPTGLLAESLGLSERTVREWRSKWRGGTLLCTQAPSCLLTSCPPSLKTSLKSRLSAQSGQLGAGGTRRAPAFTTQEEK